jgi:hypothetical protein
MYIYLFIYIYLYIQSDCFIDKYVLCFISKGHVGVLSLIKFIHATI